MACFAYILILFTFSCCSPCLGNRSGVEAGIVDIYGKKVGQGIFPKKDCIAPFCGFMSISKP
jgi:hypothetical protein